MDINKANLAKKMDKALSRKPVDTDMVVQVLCESANFTEEQSNLAMQAFLPSVVQMHKKLDKLMQMVDDASRISDSVLAHYFLNNPYVLEGFDVVEHSSKEQ